MTVLHADIDAFFASVEQLRNPWLRGRPVAVGSGVVASASYEARARGLRNGMPLHAARRLCPDLVVLPGRHEVYRCFAAAVWEILRRAAPALETLLDEAFCDFTGTGLSGPDLLELGRRLRREIRQETGLAVTVGIGRNRLMAKIASKSAKPDGLLRIPPEAEEEVLSPLPIERLPGMGPRTAALFHDMNIRTVGEFRALSRAALQALLGRAGAALYERARGNDTRPLRAEEVPKSVSRETTLSEATADPAELEATLAYLADRAMRAVRRLGLRARTLAVSIRYSDGEEERGSAPVGPTAIDEEVLPPARGLLRALWRRRVRVRHLGIVLSGLVPEDGQGDLFSDGRLRRLHEAVDRVRDRYGHGAIVAGGAIALLGRLPKDAYGYVLRTPSLTK